MQRLRIIPAKTANHSWASISQIDNLDVQSCLAELHVQKMGLMVRVLYFLRVQMLEHTSIRLSLKPVELLATSYLSRRLLAKWGQVAPQNAPMHSCYYLFSTPVRAHVGRRCGRIVTDDEFSCREKCSFVEYLKIYTAWPPGCNDCLEVSQIATRKSGSENAGLQILPSKA